MAVIQAANRKKVAVMISVIGKNTYGTLCDLCSPFDALRDLLQRHFKPKRLEVAESYRFHRQEENEKGSQYSLPLLIVKEGSCALFGRDWLGQICQV